MAAVLATAAMYAKEREVVVLGMQVIQTDPGAESMERKSALPRSLAPHHRTCSALRAGSVNRTALDCSAPIASGQSAHEPNAQTHGH